MQRRLGVIYSILGVLVLLGLALLVLVRLNNARTYNLQEAQASFKRVQLTVNQALKDNAQTATAIRQYVHLVPTVRAIAFYDPEKGVRYVWSADPQTIVQGPGDLASFRGFPDYRISDVSEAMLRAPLDGPNSRGLYLDVVYQVLAFTDVYGPLRDSLIVLLAFALVTVIAALLVARPTQRQIEPQASQHDEEARVEPQAPRPAPSQKTPEPQPQTAPSVTPETHARTRRRFDDSLEFEEIGLEEIATEPGEPGSLFNPITGLSHRNHLERRLGLELERSAYNDQDLTCLVIKFGSITGKDDYVERARQLLATFQFEDLCFEYGDDSFCVILPNTELPQGMRQAESFRKKHPECTIGISARNGRLVEAGRVLTEADRSLGHAANEPGGIVGFRPDPRKYRQFVTQHLTSDE